MGRKKNSLPEGFSFFDEYCRRRGDDPAKERAAMKARPSPDSWPSYLSIEQPSKATKPEHLAAMGKLQAKCQSLSGDDCMKMIASKDALREFLFELLFDGIVEIAQGVMEGAK